MHNPSNAQPPVARQRTRKQQEASRANGAKSKGPKTEAGKQKSSGNSWVHGLYSDRILITRLEQTDRFKDLLRAFEIEWQPAGPTEATLVRSLAAESLLLDRWRSLEAAALDSMIQRTDPLDPEIFSAPPDPLEHASAGFEIYTQHGYLPNLQTIERAIARADRTFRAALASLLLLRKTAQPARPPACQEPKPAPPGEPSESLERRLAGFRPLEEPVAGRKAGNRETNPGAPQAAGNEKVAALTEVRKSLFPGFTPDVFNPVRVPNPVPPARQGWKKEPAA